jgi:hypothetical protein
MSSDPNAFAAISWLCSACAVLVAFAWLLDVWWNLRSIAKSAKQIAARCDTLAERDVIGDMDLDLVEAALYLRAIHARQEGVEPDIRKALEELVRVRRERKK